MGRKINNGRFTRCYDKTLTKEYLEKAYPKDGAQKIAIKFGINVRTVYNYLESYNIPRNKKKNSRIKAGQIWGLLKTVCIVGKLKNGTYKWKCECECGKETIVPSSRIKAGKVKSCGCLAKRKHNHRWKGYAGISGSRISEIRLRARKKNFDFDLDAKFLWDLFIKQNRKCAITGIEIDLDKDGSLDRIDSNGGYTKNNVWWVTKDINKMKLDFTLDYFLKLCEIVVANKEQIKWA